MMDTKIFTIGGKKWRISVVETTRPKASLDQQDALVQAQLKIKEEQELDGVLLFVVDVLNEEATFISSSAAGSALVEAAWGVPVHVAQTPLTWVRGGVPLYYYVRHGLEGAAKAVDARTRRTFRERARAHLYLEKRENDVEIG